VEIGRNDQAPMFNELARRAALNMGEYLNATETYLRHEFKAQAQCRSTIGLRRGKLSVRLTQQSTECGRVSGWNRCES
jgi:hypothetical protein